MFVLDVAHRARGDQFDYPSMQAGASSHSRGTWVARVAEELDAPAEALGAEGECGRESLFDRVESEEEHEGLTAELQMLVEDMMAEESQQSCSLCGLGLVGECLRMQSCRHLVCGVCALGGAKEWFHCGVCGVPSKRVVEAFPAEGARGGVLRELAEECLSSTQVVLEFGNRFVDGGKGKYTTYARVLGASPGRGVKMPVASQLIAGVDFNINPGYPTPRDGRVRAPNHKLGFAFEYSMARPFPCYMTISWHADLKLPPVEIPYRNCAANCRHKLIIHLPATRAAGRPKKQPFQFDYEAGGNGNGWLMVSDTNAMSVVHGTRRFDTHEQAASNSSLSNCVGSTSNLQRVSSIDKRRICTTLLDGAEAGIELKALCAESSRDDRAVFTRLVQCEAAVQAYNQLRRKAAQPAARSVQTGRPQGFFHVAIDCPGYGRSPGDCQTVRSYPGSFLRSVITALGKRHAYGLIGSSQGACSVFNAVLEVPKLTHFVAVRDPVGHDPQRYSAIQQPCLLVFDVDDPGHPVTVGRRMKSYLPRPVYLEHSSLKQPFFHEQRMAAQLIQMMDERVAECARPLSDGSSAKLPLLAQVAGGLRCWSQAHGREPKAWEDS
eukprot:TRINITY_DN2992_c0_g1_i2.p1 TRINITY_DN2992_c0_g1~~TRINITY_DN2992_c0_g1_i2.p1  ORF type:complete len:607 (-),score=135.32 TRINITY_DN2992_c0_g1_i2:313-2133(-)